MSLKEKFFPKQSPKNLSEEQKQKNKEDLIESISSAGIDEFIEYIRSPWRMLWPNFIAGVARGIGALIGAALVLALIGWILAQMISLPLIGERIEPYIQKVQTEINKYTESTNYKQNFDKMEQLLQEIRDELKKQ